MSCCPMFELEMKKNPPKKKHINLGTLWKNETISQKCALVQDLIIAQCGTLALAHSPKNSNMTVRRV